MLTIDLSGKVALVTGGSRGIGAGIVQALCQAGAFVVFTHTGNQKYRERLEEFLIHIREEGGRVEAAAMDAVNSADTNNLVGKIIEDHGKIDILVPNVGQNIARPAEDVSDEEWTRAIDINLTSAFIAVRAVLPHMIKVRYGRIILIGSSAAYDGGGGAIDYAASKAGLNGMMFYLTKNYARKGITTNTVHPCVIETDLLRERYSSEESKKGLISQIPVGRLGQPEDIGWIAAYLSSSLGEFICGQSIIIDGGRTLWR